MTSVHAANRRIAKSGAPTRDIAIQSNSTLYKLAAAIIDSFGFDFDHAFGFFSTDFKQPMFHQAKRQYELFTDMLTSNLPTREALRKPPSKKYGKRSAIKKKKYPYIVAKHGNAPQQYEY